MLASTDTTKTAASYGIFLPHLIFCLWSPKNQEGVEEVEVYQKGVAHLVKTVKIGQHRF